jgi:Asp-tRNA(Asn)/Glu-tRNA(Gln) amidotransferase A subunit family amidase
MIKKLLTPMLLLTSTFTLASVNQFDELTINQLHQGVASGKMSFADVTQYYLDNIKALNPNLNAVISLNPNALQQAVQKDKTYKKDEQQGLLYGVPVLLKDNIDTDFLPTTAGAIALKDNRPKANAPIVEKLLSEGAIILGKANLSELANFKSSPSVSGYSSVGGQTRNPYDDKVTPCGSSSGSAAAVSSNLALVSLGTETDGSIHCPSAMNGVVGYKPSIHHIAQQGIIPIAHSQDTAGPITRTVNDAKLTYMAITDVPIQKQNVTLKNKRIGVIPKMNHFNVGFDAEFKATLSKLKNAGAIVVDNIELKDMEQVFPAEFDVLLYEFNQGMTAYLSKTGNNVKTKSLSALIEFNRSKGDNKQDLLLAAVDATDEKKYKRALDKIDKYAKQQLQAVFKFHRLDAIIAPTTGPAWLIDPIKGDKYSGSSSVLAAVTGSPSITIPMGLRNNLPYAVSIIGTLNDDANVLAIAQAIETLTEGRVPPKMQSNDSGASL